MGSQALPHRFSPTSTMIRRTSWPSVLPCSEAHQGGAVGTAA